MDLMFSIKCKYSVGIITGIYMHCIISGVFLRVTKLKYWEKLLVLLKCVYTLSEAINHYSCEMKVASGTHH